MSVPIDQILPVFFAAMQSGYAAGAKEGIVTELPGSKIITYSQNEFRVVDCYLVTPYSDYSFGTTTIWFEDIPVWMMQYRGRYLKKVIPFLKQALLRAYSSYQFVGGRGPKVYMADDGSKFDYVNRVDVADWRNFRGHEEILFPGKKYNPISWHDYVGLLLL